MSGYEAVLSAAKQLSASKRLRLINELAGTIPGDAPPELSKRWSGEIERRLAEIDGRLRIQFLRAERDGCSIPSRPVDLCPNCGEHLLNEMPHFFGTLVCPHCNSQLLFRWNSGDSLMSSNDWAVYRFDFNGNEVLVEKRLTEERARELVAEFESHQHHQHYWACRLPDVPINYTQMLRDLLNAGSPLNASLQVLRNQNASLVQCVEAVREARGLDQSEAKELGAFSPAFAD